MTDNMLVYVTVPALEEAEKIATALVEQQLVAGVNIVPHVQSVFWWKHTMTREQEILLMLISQTRLFDSIVQTITAMHSYEVPVILAIPVLAGSSDALNWISAETHVELHSS
jgi:periplasmic divalent cation tolerance protein